MRLASDRMPLKSLGATMETLLRESTAIVHPFSGSVKKVGVMPSVSAWVFKTTVRMRDSQGGRKEVRVGCLECSRMPAL